MAYVPPHLRKNAFSVQPLKKYPPTIGSLFERVRLENYGKADGAWFGDDRS